VLLVVGVFAWWSKPVDGVFIAALLTIIGLSVNDTVVVFDRVRERMRERPGDPLGLVANQAVLQTVPRTINTGIGAMVILGALVVLGGDSLGDFALALLLGLVIGTLSSTFVATPLLLVLSGRARGAAGRRGRSSSSGSRRPPAVDPYAGVPSGR
jgi:SecD/SecF fusion protein